MLVRVGTLISSSVGTGEASGGIRPGTALMTWTGFAPAVSGVTLFLAPGVGAATWIGYAPSVGKLSTISPGVGAATWTGPNPTVTGLIPDTALLWGSGNVLQWGGADLIWGT